MKKGLKVLLVALGATILTAGAFGAVYGMSAKVRSAVNGFVAGNVIGYDKTDWGKVKYDLNYEINDKDAAAKTATISYSSNSDNTELVKVPETITDGGVVYTVKKVFLWSNYAKAIQVPDSVTSFAAGTDEELPESINLQYAELGKGITALGPNSFNYCASLKSVKFNGNIAKIDGGAFSYSGIESFTVPETVTSFDCGVFKFSKIKHLSFASDASIGTISLANCFYLETVKLPANNVGVIQIDGCASLKEIELPEKTTNLQANDCVSLKNVTLPSDIKTGAVVGSFLDWIRVKAPSYTVGEKAFNNKTPVFFDAYKADVTWATLATERTDADQKVYFKGQWKLVNGVPQAIEGAEASVKGTTTSSSSAAA